MTVAIYSREEVEMLLREKFPPNTAVISFCDPPVDVVEEDYTPVDYCGQAERLFQTAVHDICYDELGDYQLSYEEYFPEADELAEFIISAQRDGLDIICQCEYGQSRSAGCAAAILEFFCHRGISVFADYRYCPNQMIYNKIYEALQGL